MKGHIYYEEGSHLALLQAATIRSVIHQSGSIGNCMSLSLSERQVKASLKN